MPYPYYYLSKLFINLSMSAIHASSKIIRRTSITASIISPNTLKRRIKLSGTIQQCLDEDDRVSISEPDTTFNSLVQDVTSILQKRSLIPI